MKTPERDGEPFRRKLNARGVAKYSDVGYVELEGYIISQKRCKIRHQIQLMTNRKSFP